MAIALRLTEPELTAETLEALARVNPGYRFERSPEGKLIVSPTGFFPSGGEGELFAQVLAWTKLSKCGRAFPSSAGLTLPDTAIVSPDTTYVSNGRLAAMTPEDRRPAYAKLVPDAVFELVSPSDDLREVEEKMERYSANGVRVAVMIEPDTLMVAIWRPGRDRVNFVTPTVEIGPVMPGFVLDASAVRAAAL